MNVDNLELSTTSTNFFVYKCGNVLQIKPSSGNRKRHRGLYAVTLKSFKKGTENSTLHWYCLENSILEQL